MRTFTATFGKQEITMKKTVAFIAATLLATAAYASCRYYTVTINGKFYSCSECCYGTGAARTCNTVCN